MKNLAFLALIMAIPTQVGAQNIATAELSGRERLALAPVPVTRRDVTDHPYRVIGQVEVSITKAFVFSKNPSIDALAMKLWEEAKKLGADAVINAEFEQSERGGSLGYGSREARGQAVKFLSEAEAAQWRAQNSSNED